MFSVAIKMKFAVEIGCIVAIFLSGAIVVCSREQPSESQTPTKSLEFLSIGEVTPFSNVASKALKDGFQIWNDRPGVVVFDYDRDGDLDFYTTAQSGHSNWLYRNEGDGTFTNVSQDAGVDAVESNSTGAVACDINNDGYQDLYVGAWGNPDDDLDFRSPSEGQGNEDHLFLNNGDGTFQDITASAFGDAVNLRSATSVACADVDGDGWVDIFVGNLADDDFRAFDSPSHPGHYNVLYRNNSNLTFTEMAERAGVRGSQIIMRDSDGKPVLFEDPQTGEKYEGYDPTIMDELGNLVGEPTGQTHAVLFFDHDGDGDLDLWIANDGDRLHVYRNDSSVGSIRFTSVDAAIKADQVGNWMGFATGDYDGDGDLDVFVTNMGYHPLLRKPPERVTGSCEYNQQFAWGTCSHSLLRNDGTRHVPELGKVGQFSNVVSATEVTPSPLMPPDSLDTSKIHPQHQVPSGLAAYDFGFGATFFDYDNDGVQDLYWLGSTVARGEAPGGQAYPGAGRMLRGIGSGSFEDITVRAQLLDIMGAVYSHLFDSEFPLEARRISGKYHENGKGLAHGDINSDGYVDLIGTNSSGAKFFGDDIELAPGPVFVWINGGGANNWITLRLKGRMAIDGTGSNADAIGARVFLRVEGEGNREPIAQVQEVRAGSSYLSMDSIDLEFGLGTALAVEEITIHWPSGRRQTLRNVSANQVLTVTEPEA